MTHSGRAGWGPVELGVCVACVSPPTVCPRQGGVPTQRSAPPPQTLELFLYIENNFTLILPRPRPPQATLDLEARQLRDGEYVAVRRFTRILERGPDAKATVDEVCCAVLCFFLGRGEEGDGLGAGVVCVCMYVDGCVVVVLSGEDWGVGLGGSGKASQGKPFLLQRGPWVREVGRRVHPSHPVRLQTPADAGRQVIAAQGEARNPRPDPPLPPPPPFLQVVDACGVLINLRTAVLRYRQPRSLDRFFRCARKVGWQCGVPCGPSSNPYSADPLRSQEQRTPRTRILLPRLQLSRKAQRNTPQPRNPLSHLPLAPQARDSGPAQRLPAGLRLPGEVLHAHRLDGLPAGKLGPGSRLAWLPRSAAGATPRLGQNPARFCLGIPHIVASPCLPPPPLQFCQSRGRRLTFEEWMAARPDVCQARDFIHQNPATALAPLPLVLPLTPAPSASLPTPVPSGRCAAVAIASLGGQGKCWAALADRPWARLAAQCCTRDCLPGPSRQRRPVDAPAGTSAWTSSAVC